MAARTDLSDDVREVVTRCPGSWNRVPKHQPHAVPRRTAARHGRITPPLRLLLEIVARACKRTLSAGSAKGALGDVLGTATHRERQGEVQKKLDVIANEVLIEANVWGGHLAAMASEEMDTISVVPTATTRARYLLLFSPLDGSSNIDVNVSIGTIFSVLRKGRPTTAASARTTSCNPASSRPRPATASTARRPRWC